MFSHTPWLVLYGTVQRSCKGQRLFRILSHSRGKSGSTSPNQTNPVSTEVFIRRWTRSSSSSPFSSTAIHTGPSSCVPSYLCPKNLNPALLYYPFRCFNPLLRLHLRNVYAFAAQSKDALPPPPHRSKSLARTVTRTAGLVMHGQLWKCSHPLKLGAVRVI